MAWTIPTYAGTKASGNPSNWRIAMFELCRAVNERQACGAGVLTTFYKADGTLGSNLTMADLDLIYTGRLPGDSESNVNLNMLRIQNAIRDMLVGNNFTEASASSNILSIAEVESMIGTSLGASPRGPCDARFWQAQQDALDLMIHLRKVSGISYTAAGHTAHILKRVGGSSTAQNAWDGMIADTPFDVASLGSGGGYFSASYNPFSSGYGARTSLQDASTPARVNATIAVGNLVKVEYVVQLLRSDDSIFTGEMPFQCGSASASFSWFAGFQPTPTGPFYGQEIIVGSPSDLTLGSFCDVVTTVTIPDVTPFTFSASATYVEADFSAQATDAILYVDIAGELTDQA